MHLHVTQAIALLQSGQPIALPTETVYGLAADATNPEAVARIYALKDRPAFNPLISHYAGVAEAEADVVFSPLAYKLAERFWPGPLTLVLPQREESRLARITTAALPTAAVRVPAHPLMREVLCGFGLPLAAPSANPSGRVSPTRAEHVQRQLGERIALVLDGGACTVGLESTIVDLSTPTPALLREGVITRTDLEPLTGPLATPDGHTIKAPGMLLRHYAPSCPLSFGAVASPPAGAVLLTFGSQPVPEGYDHVWNLSESADLTEAAARVFDLLHQADHIGATAIHVMPLPREGVGAAIYDRLLRASRG